MPELQPAHWTGGDGVTPVCHTAQGDRALLSSLVCVEGVVNPTSGALEVTAGAGLSVDVAEGRAFIAGTESAEQFMYHATNLGVTNVTLAAADPTDDRIDLIVARVYDAEYSGSDNEWVLEAVTGTPSPAPVAPALPDSSLLLATVTVESAATAPSSITDGRLPVTYCGSAAGLLEIVLYTNTGTFEKADYPGGQYVIARGVGGGGGSGGTYANGGVGSGFCSGPGAGGTYGEARVPFDDMSSVEPVTIGNGGTAGNGSNSIGLVTDGGDGGNTQFSTFLICPGGDGGESDADSDDNHVTAGGAYGGAATGSHRYLSVNGESASNPRVIGGEPFPERGGASFFGPGARPGVGINVSDGGPGGTYGGGASSAYVRPDLFADSDGAAGAKGVLLIEVYGA